MALLPRRLLILGLLWQALRAGADEFIYAGFTDASPPLITQAYAHVDDSGILELTNNTQRTLGRAFHAKPIRLRRTAGSAVAEFSTNFVISIAPQYPTLGGHGLAFMMAASTAINGALPSQYLGMFTTNNSGDPGNHILAVEFDTIRDFEFDDIDDNHVGVDVNGLVSVASASAAYFNESRDLVKFNLKSQSFVRCWVDYHSARDRIDVTVAPGSRPRPAQPLISANVVLGGVVTDSVYVGFSASNGILSSIHRVLGWSFNTSGAAADLDPAALPRPPGDGGSRPATKLALAVALTAVTLALFLVAGGAEIVRRMRRAAEQIEDWERQFGPHRFSLAELREATRDFSDVNLLGCGGFGRVYAGTMPGSGLRVAVKKMSHDSSQGFRQFFSEIASIGRLRHRNLVKLHGWCRHRGDLFLVYDFMPNGSLDKILFADEESDAGLPWRQRYNILRGVASALVYLHEEWEQQVVHRDIKASNVLLDSEWNGRLGDFGLARLYEHGDNPQTTHVVGTLGYMAPELTRTGRATTASDVFAFGALMLEVACGRRPVDSKRVTEEVVLVEWLWELQTKGKLLQAVDGRLCSEFEAEEAEMVLEVGLWCSHPQAEARPTMRQVLQMMSGDRPVPKLPAEAEKTPWSVGDCWELSVIAGSSCVGSPTTSSHSAASPLSLLPEPVWNLNAPKD